MSNISSYFFIF